MKLRKWSILAVLSLSLIMCGTQGQYWASRTPPNNPPPNMAAANFVVITNGEGCALNGTAVAAVFIDLYLATCFLSASCDWL